MKPKSAIRLAFPLAAAIAAMFASSSVYADQTWDGGSTGPGDDNLNTPANWGADTLPTFTNAITFAGDIRNSTNNNLTADSIIGGINFTNNGSTGNANAFALAGNRITLGGNITTTANTAGSTVTDTISLEMILNGNRITTTNQSSNAVQHNLTISGIILESAVGLRKTVRFGHSRLLIAYFTLVSLKFIR